jgi:hypothetical protein
LVLHNMLGPEELKQIALATSLNQAESKPSDHTASKIIQSYVILQQPEALEDGIETEHASVHEDDLEAEDHVRHEAEGRAAQGEAQVLMDKEAQVLMDKEAQVLMDKEAQVLMDKEAQVLMDKEVSKLHTKLIAAEKKRLVTEAAQRERERQKEPVDEEGLGDAWLARQTERGRRPETLSLLAWRNCGDSD